MINLDKVKEVFTNYVNTFDWNMREIPLKYYHTLEVAKICNQLAKRLHLSDEDVELATLIGFLHDIGRFYQLTKTGTFKDIKMDHAEYGVKLLFDEGMIRSFIADPKYDEIIKKAVRNHNKYAVEEELNERERLFANIIRDCDKIDIFRVLVVYYQDEIIDSPSAKILTDFLNEKAIWIKDIKNKADAVICKMAYIFDIHYKEAIDILKEKGYYLEYINKVKVNKENEEMFNQAKERALTYLKKRSEGNAR